MQLLSQTTLGNLTLNNKMIMAAMTRSRATATGVPTPLMAEYYAQRASASLILSEAINISEDAIGSPLTPDIYTEEQIEQWKIVTQAVHQKGGKIFAQLWHTGRVGHSIDRKGTLPVAPSAIKIEGMQHFTSQGLQDFETPRELSRGEIQQIIADYAQAAKNALRAGFDGVEFHAANGYLPNQFLADSSNQRTDEYGQDKTLFVVQTMQALIDAIGGERVGIKIGPLHPYANIAFDDPIASYQKLFEQLNKLDFAFVEIMKRAPMFPLLAHYPLGDEIAIFAPMSHHPVIANGGYHRESTENELQGGLAQWISFGTSFLANPDLPRRFALNAPLNQPDRATMFGGGEQGYTDYPTLA
ncbi:MAG: alkene reductase [Pasteurellaceae bacterium]|nr:alkene reductase [Pasteurellaceae bacterium]